MKRLARRAINILAGVCLALCLAVALLWVRGRWLFDAYAWDTPNSHVGIAAEDGRFILWRLPYGPAIKRPAGPVGYRSVPARDDALMPGRGARTFAGFFYWEARHPLSLPCDFYGVPYWAVLALAAPLPLLRAAARLRARRGNWLGLCRACGYDLRATPDRCPECGRPVPQRKGLDKAKKNRVPEAQRQEGGGRKGVRSPSPGRTPD